MSKPFVNELPSSTTPYARCSRCDCVRRLVWDERLGGDLVCHACVLELMGRADVRARVGDGWVELANTGRMKG